MSLDFPASHALYPPSTFMRLRIAALAVKLCARIALVIPDDSHRWPIQVCRVCQGTSNLLTHLLYGIQFDLVRERARERELDPVPIMLSSDVT